MKERNSNFELLKIILTIMVIILHYCNSSMGGLLGNVEKGSLNYYLSHSIESLCIIAVNTFVIITGYFSCDKKEIKISKPLKLFLLSVFYGVFISGIIIVLTKQSFSIQLAKEIILASFNRWFVVIYCILYLLIPFINKLISGINKKQFQTLLIINIIFFYIWPTFFTSITLRDNGYGIINFINLFLTGAYIKKFIKYDISKKKLILIFIIGTTITTLFSFVASRAWSYSSIFNLINSITLFLLFKSIKIKNNKTINKLATYTFSTYIIHENSFLVKILYRNIFNSDKYWSNNLMILNLIITVFGIYIICIIIENIRKILFKKIFDDKIDNINYIISCK